MKRTCHAMRLGDEARAQARRRLQSVRGHVDGVLRMLDDDSAYCVDVLTQLKAVSGALEKVSALILQSHLRAHVVTASERGDADAMVSELMEVLKYR